MIVIKHRKSPDVVLLRVNASRLDDRDLTGAYLLGARMVGLRGHRVVLLGATLRNAELCGADFEGANLKGADLRSANLQGINLANATLTEADLRGANLRRADLRGADLSRAMLFEADLAEVRCDAGTRWPEGDAWGLLAGVPRANESGPTRLKMESWCADAQQRLAHWMARSWPDGSTRSRPVTVLGPTLRLATAGMAMTLLVAALADMDVDLGAKSAHQEAPTPSVVARLPEPVQSDPIRVSGSTAAAAQKPEPRAAFPPSAIRTAARDEHPERKVHARFARARVFHATPAGPHPTRSVTPQLARSEQPAGPDQPDLRSQQGSGGSWRGYSGRVVLAAARNPVRQRVRPMPELTEPAQTEQLPARPVAEPTKVVQAETRPTPVLAEQATEKAPTPKRRKEVNSRAGQLAWGNRDFHYGSGYDIYSMHLKDDKEDAE